MREDGSMARIRSLAEACLCVMVRTCEACGEGPLRAAGPIAYDGAAAVLRIPVVCGACGRQATLVFGADRSAMPESLPERLPDVRSLPAEEAGWAICPGDEPSQVVDVPGWVTLFTMLSEAAREGAHRRDAGATPHRLETGATPDTAAGHGGPALQASGVRRLNMLAGCCLDEALKLFDADNDVPPEDAFFSEASRRQFHDRPERFTRQRIIDLRSQLPVARSAATGGTDQPEGAKAKRRWWHRRR